MAEVTRTYQAITGTSANAYPSDPQYQNTRIGTFKSKSITIQNTDASNSITFKVKVKPRIDSDYTDYPGAAETALAAGVDGVIAVPEIFYEIAVEVKSTVSDSHGTFEITMSGRSD
jgi:hypothetical protein